MTSTAIGSIGERQDLLIQKGADYSVTVTLSNPDGTPMDLTGSTVIAQMRKRSDTDLVAAFTVVISNPTGGVFVFGLTHEQTTALVCGESLNEPKSQYVWGMKLQDVIGGITPLFYGVVSVAREVPHV